MATTTVKVGGKGTNPKTTLYVGGLEESVNEAILHSAFIPFGEIKDVNIPLDNTTGKHRGFGFVEFEAKGSSLRSLCNRLSCSLTTSLKAKEGLCKQVLSLKAIHCPSLPSDDAEAAIDNMHNGELYGRVLRVNYAQPMKIKGGDKGWSHQPVWADADDWYEKQLAEEDLKKMEDDQRLRAQVR
jgi:peptidyl-prolyl isomerase E (cyclophilin E)